MLALAFYLVVQLLINFDGVNSSLVVKNSTPYNFHEKITIFSAFLLFISLVSFGAGYYEYEFMFSINSVLSAIAIVGAFVIVVVSLLASNKISSQIDTSDPINNNKCIIAL
jgi:magnesium-transporting ATPase (P-type)